MSKTKRYVFVNGYGLVRFKSTESVTYSDGTIQLHGKIKRRGLRSGGGKKWIQHDYWYNTDQVFTSREEAIQYLWDSTGVSEENVRPEKLDPQMYEFVVMDFGMDSSQNVVFKGSVKNGEVKWEENKTPIDSFSGDNTTHTLSTKEEILLGTSTCFLGKTLEEARATLADFNIQNRVSVIDGYGQIGTCDFQPERVNLTVQDGRVVHYTLG